jgi:hypothetical protein
VLQGRERGHEGGGAVGRHGVVAVNGGEACTVVTDDGALALHHGERERGEVGVENDGKGCG